MRNKINILISLLILLVSIYLIKILKLTGICCLFISILSPLFFGYVLSWILRPIINKIKYNRVIVTILIYLLFFSMVIFLVMKLLPIIIIECKKIIPIIIYFVRNNKSINNIYNSLNINNFFKNNLKSLNICFNNILSIILNVIYSLIFGFYFLIEKDKNYFKFIPNKLRVGISIDLRNYIKSIFLDTIFMFIILCILFSLVGLSNPILFSFICSITNIIPYLGPYIGGIFPVIVGLSKSVRLGSIVLIIIVIVQVLESNIIQPLIISKNVKINPIYILIFIIIFSHFFGIIGMILATPILIILRNILKYYKKNKPKWFNLILDKL